MALVRSRASLELVRENYIDPYPDNEENMLLISAMLRPGQKRIIDGVAAATGLKKGEALRAILDEWCEFVLAQRERELS